MQERYEFMKVMFPNYLILMVKKDKIKTINEDEQILKFFGDAVLKEVNYIILDNLDIIKKQEVKNNRYQEYYIKTKLVRAIKDLKGKLVNGKCQ